jgi:FKBP-type peptidyl-prolyl cis-trans isomerase 2
VTQGDVLSDGKPGSRSWIVVEHDSENAVLDGNHPLAGKTLIFDVTLVAIN